MNSGDIFSIECSREADLQDVAEEVKKKLKYALEDVSLVDLAVWRGKNPTMDAENACVFVKSIDFSDNEAVERLSFMRKLAPLNLREDEVLLVERPGMSSHSSHSSSHVVYVTDRHLKRPYAADLLHELSSFH